tara:strand:- start:363 stop:746 length:384 start_codon:yes stop_codon:yes gene_type:complete
MFEYGEVKHLITPRLPPPTVHYGGQDLEDFKGVVASTKMPNQVVLSLEAARMHFFLHDCQRIQMCVWEHTVTYDEKKEIVMNMVRWLQSTKYSSLNHLLHDYEDGSIFTEVYNELANVKSETAVESE